MTMLVLTRKSEEKIVVGRGSAKVTITVLKIQGDKVSIGIEAPPELPIWREELLDETNSAISLGAGQKGVVSGTATMAQAVQDLQINVGYKIGDKKREMTNS